MHCEVFGRFGGCVEDLRLVLKMEHRVDVGKAVGEKGEIVA
jgi:hypothetical protein